MFKAQYNISVTNTGSLDSDSAEFHRSNEDSRYAEVENWRIQVLAAQHAIRTIYTADDKILYRNSFPLKEGTIMLGINASANSTKSPAAHFVANSTIDRDQRFWMMGINEIQNVGLTAIYTAPWQIHPEGNIDFTVLVSDIMPLAKMERVDEIRYTLEAKTASWAVFARYVRKKFHTRRIVQLITERPIDDALASDLQQFLNEHCLSNFSDLLKTWAEFVDLP